VQIGGVVDMGDDVYLKFDDEEEVGGDYSEWTKIMEATGSVHGKLQTEREYDVYTIF
jgi:hypothetical protein